jgi:hypothetical protein
MVNLKCVEATDSHKKKRCHHGLQWLACEGIPILRRHGLPGKSVFLVIKHGLLEIPFSEMMKPQRTKPPWLVREFFQAP